MSTIIGPRLAEFTLAVLPESAVTPAPLSLDSYHVLPEARTLSHREVVQLIARLSAPVSFVVCPYGSRVALGYWVFEDTEREQRYRAHETGIKRIVEHTNQGALQQGRSASIVAVSRDQDTPLSDVILSLDEFEHWCHACRLPLASWSLDYAKGERTSGASHVLRVSPGGGGLFTQIF